MRGTQRLQQNEILRKVLLREHLLAALSLLLFIALVVLVANPFSCQIKRGLRQLHLVTQNLPAENQVYQVIDRLEYSGLQMLKENHVSIAVNFNKGTWVLRDINQFDEQGNFVLDAGKYGTCGELAAYTYGKIKPLLSGNYDLAFVKASQSGYFLYPVAGHIVVKISPKVTSENSATYIVDPAFHKYGPIGEFEDYYFQEEMGELPFIQDRQKDIELDIGTLFPLLIRQQHLLGVMVIDNLGKFDKDNYMFALIVNKKHNFSGKPIFLLRNNNGEEEFLEENPDLRRQVLSDTEYADLKNRIFALFRGVEK